MGFGPDQVERWSFWKFAACVDGYRAGQSSGETTPDAPSWEDHLAAVARADTIH